MKSLYESGIRAVTFTFQSLHIYHVRQEAVIHLCACYSIGALDVGKIRVGCNGFLESHSVPLVAAQGNQRIALANCVVFSNVF